MRTYQFSRSLLALVAVVAIADVADRHAQDVMRPASVFRVDEIEVITSMRLVSSSGPTLTAGTGDPSGAVTAPEGSLRLRTDTAALYQNTDSGTTWVQAGGASGTPGAAIVQQALPATVDLTTIGTIDWLYPPLGAQPSAAAANGLNAKLTGGWLRQSFAWKTDSGTQLSQSSGITVSATAADNLGSSILSASTANGYFCNGCGSTGYGATFRVPAVASNRVLRIYTNEFSLTITVTVRLSDGSIAPVSSSRVTGGGLGTSTLWQITYQARSPGVDLIVTVMSSASTGTGNQIKIAAIALGET